MACQLARRRSIDGIRRARSVPTQASVTTPAVAIAVLVATGLSGASAERTEQARRCSNSTESTTRPPETTSTVAAPAISLTPAELTAAARSVSPRVRVGRW